ncbi:unnamed protein product [Calypogeia fissa]
MFTDGNDSRRPKAAGLRPKTKLSWDSASPISTSLLALSQNSAVTVSNRQSTEVYSGEFSEVFWAHLGKEGNCQCGRSVLINPASYLLR